MSKNIMMVGDDGSVYTVDATDVARIAKKVPTDQLSPDVRAHVAASTPKPGAGYFFATSSDFFAATKNEIQAPANNDVLSANTKNFFATTNFFFTPSGGGPGGKTEG